MSKALSKYNNLSLSDKENTFSRIQRLVNEGDVVLTANEEVILKRWNYAHTQILTRKLTEDQITEKVADIFHVSQYTARDDYYKAMALYSGLIKVNKKFLLHRHAENILMKIERFSLDKSLVHLIPKLMEVYTKTVAAIPDELGKEDMPPPVINFNIVAGQKIADLPTLNDAIDRLNNTTSVEDVDYSQIPESYEQE